MEVVQSDRDVLLARMHDLFVYNQEETRNSFFQGERGVFETRAPY